MKALAILIVAGLVVIVFTACFGFPKYTPPETVFYGETDIPHGEIQLDSGPNLTGTDDWTSIEYMNVAPQGGCTASRPLVVNSSTGEVYACMSTGAWNVAIVSNK